MNRHWPDEALAFADSVRATLARLGGVDLARRAENDPSVRRHELGPALERLGFPEIDALESGPDAVAAAAAARAAGAVVAPWPVATQLAAGVYLTLHPPKRLEHLDLAGDAVAVDLRTRRATPLVALGAVDAMPLDPFGVRCRLAPTNGSQGDDGRFRRASDAYIVLAAFYVLGALEAATDLAAVYAGERRQFGQPIAEFGAIQWRLSDVVVARDGLAELAAYTLWRFCERSASPADIIALRLAMLESAAAVLANTHQIFGAIGLCEEHDLAVIDRHLQPLLRRPSGTAATSAILRDEILAHGFAGLFPIRGVAARPEVPA